MDVMGRLCPFLCRRRLASGRYGDSMRTHDRRGQERALHEQSFIGNDVMFPTGE